MRDNRIRELRKAAGLSQRQLAEFLEVDPSTLDRWEKGQTRPWRDDKLQRCAERLGITVPFLLGYVDSDGNERAA